MNFISTFIRTFIVSENHAAGQRESDFTFTEKLFLQNPSLVLFQITTKLHENFVCFAFLGKERISEI